MSCKLNCQGVCLYDEYFYSDIEKDGLYDDIEQEEVKELENDILLGDKV